MEETFLAFRCTILRSKFEHALDDSQRIARAIEAGFLPEQPALPEP